MAIPIGAIVALIPEIIGAIKALAGDKSKGEIHPKVKAGGIAGGVTLALLVMTQLFPDAPAIPEGLGAAITLV